MTAPLGAVGVAGPWAEAGLRLRANPAAVAGFAVLFAVGFACFVVPWLFGLDPYTTDPALRHRPPGSDFWLGSDALGRDLLARVLIQRFNPRSWFSGGTAHYPCNEMGSAGT